MGTFSASVPAAASGTAPSYTSVSGSRATSSVGSSAARRDVSEDMITFKNYRRPIMSRLLMNKLGSKPTGNQKFEWMESSLLPASDTVTISGGSTTEDAITVGDSTLYQVGTKFVVDATGEVCVVDSIASSEIDITKVGSGNITAAAAGSTIHFLSTDFEQGSASATAVSVNKSFPYNYVEIVKKSVQVTGSQKATSEYGPDDWNEQKLNRFDEMMEEAERGFIHGVRDTETTGLTGSFSQHYSGGIFDTTAAFITTALNYAGGALDEDWFFDTYLPAVFSRGADEKTLYAGQTLVAQISKFSRDKVQTVVNENAYGKKVLVVPSNFGMLNVQWHPMLEGSTFSKKGFVIDWQEGRLKYRYLAANGENRDIHFRDYREYYKQSDTDKGEWLWERGWQIEGNLYHSTIAPA